jgi:hypothetical protein
MNFNSMTSRLREVISCLGEQGRSRGERSHHVGIGPAVLLMQGMISRVHDIMKLRNIMHSLYIPGVATPGY